MMQTITEVLESALDKKVMLKKASQMKFLQMIDPVKQPLVDVSLTYKRRRRMESECHAEARRQNIYEVPGYIQQVTSQPTHNEHFERHRAAVPHSYVQQRRYAGRCIVRCA